MKVAELEVLLTSNADKAMGEAESAVKSGSKKIEANKPKVDADVKPAIEGMDRVEKAAKKIVSAKTVAVIDADIERGQAQVEKISGKLEELQARALGGLDVGADIKRAETQLAKVQRSLDGLIDARSKIEVDADTSKAESELDGLSDTARDAGAEAGEGAGSALGENIVAALVSIPIAGAVIGIGAAAAKALVGAFEDGLNVEVRQDRLQALTGIEESDAQRLGRAAGEAYANNFGESIEANMDAARLALQFDIIDPQATTRDAQIVVQGLAGIADVLGEDVQPVATAVTTLLSTGMAKSAQEAFDLIAAGARNGVNRADDLLDTFTEYPALFKRLGLSGPEALGLISQGLEAGARNGDLAADALKEFQIRATDASEGSAAAFEMLGLSAEDMTAKIARGGSDARDGLTVVLEKLRETEDPVLRNAAAVGLFGTQAEDLGDALFAMDLSSAVDQLNGVEGAAQRMFDTLADNDASKMEEARRNIEVASDGIKGALAAAFSEPLGDLAEWVSSNRGPLLQFFSDLVNGAFDFAESATEAFGAFVSGPLVDMVEGLKHVIKFINPFADTSDLETFINGMRDFDETTDLAVQGLESMRDEFNGFADGQIALGYVNDAARRTAESVDAVGVAARDGASLLSQFSQAQDGSVHVTGELKRQLDATAQALRDEYDSAILAGESQENLQQRYDSTSEALRDQLVAMGLTQDQAQSLIDTVLQTPSEAKTHYESNADEQIGKVDRLGRKIITLPDGSTIITADTAPASRSIDKLVTFASGKQIKIKVFADGSGFKLPGNGRVVTNQAAGSILEFMADGGIPGTTPMRSVAQMVPPNTYRVVGDRSDVDEAYIPLDGSPRSLAILFEAMRRMGVAPVADGATAGNSRNAAAQGGMTVSLAGATFTMLVDGRPIRAIVDQQIVDAMPSDVSIRSEFGNR